MQLLKMLGAAGALLLAAVIGGTLIGPALAAGHAAGGGDGAGAACDVFIDTLAGELGATRDELVAAGRVAATAAIDAAVEAGDLSEERATELRDRVADADGEGCGWFGHGFARGFGAGMERGLARGFLGGDVFEAAADALGIESSALIGGLREAGSLEALAEAEDVAYDEVKGSILAAVQADLDAAVAEGLSREHADAAIQRLTSWLDAGGQADGLHPGRRGFGPGPGPGNGDHHDGDAEESGA